MSTEQNEKQQVRQNGRKPFILIGGLFILTMAVAVLFFGGELADGTAETAEAISTLPIRSGPVNIGDMAIDFTLTNLDGTAGLAASFFFNEMGLTFANPLLDSELEVADKYGVRNLPTTFFIDANGQVTAVHRGPAVLSQFKDYLAATAPGLVQ